MLFISLKRATVVRVPTLALLLTGPWALLESSSWAPGGGTSPRVTVGFFAAIVAVMLLGTRVIRRVGEMIVSRGLFNTSTIPARIARVGVATRSTGRYAGIDLDLMTGPHFEASPVLNRALKLETFTPSGINGPMRVASRVAHALNLPDPMVAPWLIDTSVRGGGAPPRRIALLERWLALSRLSRFLAIAVLVSIGWTIFTWRAGAQLEVTCASPRPIRDSPVSFNLTCVGRQILNADSGPVAFGIWDDARACWVIRDLVLHENRRTRIDVDEIVKTSPCADTNWPRP